MSPSSLDAILAAFPRERTWLVPALQAAQAARGWLSPDDLAAVGTHLRVPASEVYGVATHYPDFRLRPRGTHRVRVCTGLSCRVTGGLALLDALAARLGLRPGETTPDGAVTLEEADCCFVCSVAPVAEVDHRYLGGTTADGVLAALARPPEPAATAGPAGAAGSGARSEPPASTGASASSPRPGGPAPADEPLGDARVGGPPGAVEPARPGGPDARAAGAPVAVPGTGCGPAAEPGRAAGRLAALAAGAPSPEGLRLLVATGACGLARGAARTLAALREALAATGLPARVEEGACAGLCYAAPVVEVLRPGAPRLTVERVTPERVPALLRLLRGAADHGLGGAAWAAEAVAGLPPVARHPVLGGQARHLSARWGVLAAGDLPDALRAGRYTTLARVLDEGDPGRVIAAVKAAGLLGRGGAYFPAAVKWEACRAAPGGPKYLVVNGEEGEPGIFKDRHLLEADPHLVLEGALLAAYAAGASRGILYLHGEAEPAGARCAAAVAQARAAGLLGPRVLGSDFAFDVEIRRGAGGFVLGEETALLESLEGRRAMPRTRPPFPVEVGVYGRPTVVHNVETLAAVPLVVGGRPEAARTKLFGLSGHVARPGIVEVAAPVTLRRLVEELGGGVPTGRRLGAVVVGGPSGVVVPPRLLDTPLERPALSPGTGGVVALDAAVSILDVVRTLMAFNARESCGKCTPCREGTVRMLEALDRLAAGDADAADLARLRELGEVVQVASLCGLGQAAPLALRSALEHFPEAFAVAPA